MSRPLEESARSLALRTATEAFGLERILLTDHAAVTWLAPDGAGPGDAVVVTKDGLALAAPEDDLLRTSSRAPMGVQNAALGRAWSGAAAGRPLFDVTAIVDRLRSRLDDDELAAVRRASAAATAAQGAFRALLEEGGSEEDLSRAVFATVEGGFPPADAIVDLMFGDRCSLVGAPPTGRRLRAGETALFDFAPRIGSYWSDSCATIVLGRAPKEVSRLHGAARRALDSALAMVRPGLPVAALDRFVRSAMDDAGYSYPHLTGHGVGLRQQDHPHVTADSPAVLEEGQVLAVEPGGYAAGFGVRVEHVFRVSDEGAEVLTGHSLDLDR